MAHPIRKEPLFDRFVYRTLLTILMYAGATLFFLPYLTGRVSTAILVVILGASVAIVCGLARCIFTEGDCSERDHIQQRIP